MGAAWFPVFAMSKMPWDDSIVLTHENFKRLDVLTRIAIGRPLVVFDKVFTEQEIRPMFGYAVDGFSADFETVVTRVPTGDGRHIDKGINCLPYITNEINVYNWFTGGNDSFWLERSAIPRELVYDFLVHHEIAHIKHGDGVLIDGWIKQGLFTAEDFRDMNPNTAIYTAIVEYRADKYAWSKIMPGKEMPEQKIHEEWKKEFKVAKEKLSIVMRRHDDEIDRAKLEGIKPISLDPSEYVPLLHAESGGMPPLIDEYGSLSRFKKFTVFVKLSFKSWFGRGALSVWLIGFMVGLYGLLRLDPFALIVGSVLVMVGTKLMKIAFVQIKPPQNKAPDWLKDQGEV